MPRWFIRIIVTFLVSCIFFVFQMKVEAKFIGVLEDILQPGSIKVYKGKAYITEKEAVHIVSLETGKLLKSFGKKGEGPGEFRRAPKIRISGNSLIVNTWGKIIYFDLAGNYQKERKHQFGRHTGAIPLGENFAAQRSDFSEKEQAAVQEFGIYDQDLKLIKKIFFGPSPEELDILPGNRKQPYPMITEKISMEVYNGRVYISDTRKGFYFEVFDKQGNRIEEILVKGIPVKVSREYKKRALEKLRSAKWWKSLKHKLEPVFPEFFPEIKFYTLNGDQIYVETHLTKGDNSLFRIYDLETKKVSEIYLPVASDRSFKRYDIRNGKYYYLKENEEDDNWELHEEELTSSVR